MKHQFPEIKKSGFGLVEVLVALGLAGGLALFVMNIGKFGNDIQRQSLAGNDEIEMISMLRGVLKKDKNCSESLKIGPSRTPITFKKSDIDEPSDNEGIEVEVFQTDYAGGVKKILSSSEPDNRFGRLKIISIKFLMNNGEGFDYPLGTLHSDSGIMRFVYEKPQGNNTVTKTADMALTATLTTNTSGISTGLNCAKDSSAIKRTVATVDNLSNSGYVNNWDQMVNFICPADKVLCGETSFHWNNTEDRRHNFQCCDIKVDNNIVRRKSCSWSGQVNYYDALINYTCPNNTLKAGHFSVHDNGTEDRLYEFYCCEYGSASQKILTENCQVLPNGAWANNWDQPVNFTCPANKVRTGEISVHNNTTEDRLYRFKCCGVVAEEF